MKHLVNTIKLSLAAGLIYWLIQSGKLDLKSLSVFFTDMQVLSITLLFWIASPILLAAYRWFLLYQCLNTSLKFGRVCLAHGIGLFFNSCLPGAVGGDIIKVMYAHRQKGDMQNGIFSALTDRVLGLASLFFLGLVAILMQNAGLESNSGFMGAYYFIIAINLVVATGVLIFLYKPLYTKVYQAVSTILSKLPGSQFTLKLLAAVDLFKANKKRLGAAYAVAVGNHLVVILYFGYLIKATVGVDLNFWALTAVFAVGGFIITLPISPGGIGIGHVAFETLFLMIGVEGGANIYNLFCISQIALNMFGILPYLFMKSDKSAPNTDNSTTTAKAPAAPTKLAS